MLMFHPLHLLVHDSQCGPCTRFKDIVDILDEKERIYFVGLVEAEESGLLESIPLARGDRSFHLVLPDGTVASGAAALPPLVGLLPAGGVFKRILELSVPVRSTTTILYTVLSRLHDSGSCAYSHLAASTSISTLRTNVGEYSPLIAGFQPALV